MRLAQPGHLVDINGLRDGLDRVEVREDHVRVGALVRHAALERDASARHTLPLLSQALRNVAHPAIRNRGTTVGSIAHADAAGEMPSVAVLTDAVIEAASTRGTREIRAREFFEGPLETTLAEDELIVAIRFGTLAAGTRTAFLESARRHGDYALAGVAAALTVADGVVCRALASFVSVTDTPDVLDLTEAISGREPESIDWSIVDDLVQGHVHPEADIHATADYRRALVGELTRRAFALAAAGDKKEDSA
jgi:carbon-monoxide dehydrogenase medium subunit